jgi:hypothetical protein
MPSASALRAQIEAALTDRIPSALTPAPRVIRPRTATGISQVDELTEGGLPVGAITEICGAASSGRTTLALSFLAQITRASRVCAWIDVSDTLQPESAAAAGVDLMRLLWVRCGVSANRMVQPPPLPMKGADPCTRAVRPWSRIEQGLRVADLLLQAGGFSAIVLDMADIAAENASRVPLATWFRYRAAAERTQASILLLTQHPCAKSSAEVVLRLRAGDAVCQESTVLTDFAYHVDVSRKRFAPSTKVVPLRKPPQRENGSRWCSQTVWAGR